MGGCISGCVQMLTCVHDMRTLHRDKKGTTTTDASGEIQKLAPAEKQPSVLLVFSIVERQENESHTISFLRKVFKKAPGLANQRNSNGETLLYFTCKLGKVKVARYLMVESSAGCNAKEVCSKGSAVHACLHAMHSGKLSSTAGCAVVGELLDRGCDIDAQDSNGWTAFFLATALECISGMKLLVARGCEVSVTCADGMTPLHKAAANGSVHAVHLLLGLSDVHIDELDCHKRTPLTVVLMSILRPTYVYGAAADHAISATSRPTIMKEREFGNRAAVVEYLLMARANPNIRHRPSNFTRTSNAHPLCLEPITLALCIFDIFKEERSNAYMLARQDTSNNPGPNLALPVPVLTKLDAMNRVYGIAVAMVMQLLQYGAEVPHKHLLQYSPTLLEHLQDIVQGQGVEGVGARTFTLQTMCRTCIRVQTAVGPDGLNGLVKLPLPSEIIQFLRFYQV